MRTVGHKVFEFAVTQNAALARIDGIQHKQQPFVAKLADYLPDGTVVVVFFKICHNDKICNKGNNNFLTTKNTKNTKFFRAFRVFRG